MNRTKLAVLPTSILESLSGQGHPDASFLKLIHPRTRLPCLFLAWSECTKPRSCNDTEEGPSSNIKLAEVQAVSPAQGRSWFLDEEVLEDGRLLVISPVDPAFLLLPILQLMSPQDGSAGTFRPADQLFDEAALQLEKEPQEDQEVDLQTLLKDIRTFCSLECTQSALSKLCDSKKITADIVVYRLSEAKTTDYMKQKVERLAAHSVMDDSKTITRSFAREGLTDDGNEDALKVARVDAACNLIGQYLPSSHLQLLRASFDFAVLDSHRKDLEKVEAARNAAAEATLPQKKKGAANKTDTLKKRKSASSQGVEKLKKVNVNGMSKLDSFFKPKATS